MSVKFVALRYICVFALFVTMHYFAQKYVLDPMRGYTPDPSKADMEKIMEQLRRHPGVSFQPQQGGGAAFRAQPARP